MFARPVSRSKFVLAFAFTALTAPCSVHAAPGLASETYGATVKKGEFEAEAIYGTLTGGSDDGEDAAKFELAYAPTDRLRIGLTTELEHEPGDRRRAEEVGVEAIYTLGRLGGIDVAIYGEYAFGLNGNSDGIEGKLLLQRRAGPFDARLNLIAAKSLRTEEKVQLSYAASADFAVVEDIRLGVQAYGDLGTFHKLLPHSEHFIGPVIKAEFEGLGPEIGMEVGYLIAVDKARDDTKGQLRVAIDVEF